MAAIMARRRSDAVMLDAGFSAALLRGAGAGALRWHGIRKRRSRSHGLAKGTAAK
jgi:hypothetical protein